MRRLVGRSVCLSYFAKRAPVFPVFPLYTLLCVNIILHCSQNLINNEDLVNPFSFHCSPPISELFPDLIPIWLFPFLDYHLCLGRRRFTFRHDTTATIGVVKEFAKRKYFFSIFAPPIFSFSVRP